MTPTPAIALTIAGSDSSGGAGIQADLKTFTALGVYGASVITALTAQNTTGVRAIHAVPPDFIAAQIDAVADDLDIAAVKTGMLGETAAVMTVCEAIERHRLAHLVVDPVMVATSGDVLLSADAIVAVRRELIPRAALVTPNLAEAAALLGTAPARSLHEMETQASQLLALGPAAVLVKGGHHVGAEEATDVLVKSDAPDEPVHFSAPRIATRNTHGTGCTLAAAITAHLALGQRLEQAVGAAKAFLSAALAAGRDHAIGHGHGPVDHLHAIRGKSAN